MINSFEIIRVLNQACQLKLFLSMKIHDTFHTFLLRKDSNDSLNDQILDSSSSVIIENEDEWKLNDVLDSRLFRKKLQYRVK